MGYKQCREERQEAGPHQTLLQDRHQADRKTEQVRCHLTQVRCRHQRDRKVDKQPASLQTVWIRCPDNIRRNHGPRGSQKKASWRKNSWFLLLISHGKENIHEATVTL